ncbi:MAG: hypothetical protein COY40_06020 [Alphaproteobacteria bacterium CG_4_10_14_0_8_um_filter_53_9]|nr:MAG: hypothetical protein COY40_06020 [Alphaproteobacteria bacterium CG_4_10_14_0_8_um_filter_53_9]
MQHQIFPTYHGAHPVTAICGHIRIPPGYILVAMEHIRAERWSPSKQADQLITTQIAWLIPADDGYLEGVIMDAPSQKGVQMKMIATRDPKEFLRLKEKGITLAPRALALLETVAA